MREIAEIAFGVLIFFGVTTVCVHASMIAITFIERRWNYQWQPKGMSDVYIAGPMSAFWADQYNRTEFEKQAAMIRAIGFNPIIPHELDAGSGIDLSRTPSSFTRDEKAAMMRRDIAAIDRSVAVWTFQIDVPSLGRDAELAHARFVGMPVFSDIEAMKAWRNGNAKAA